MVHYCHDCENNGSRIISTNNPFPLGRLLTCNNRLVTQCAHFAEEDILRKSGKEHFEYPNTKTKAPITSNHECDQEHQVHFKKEDIQRKSGKEHFEYPETKTHMPPPRRVSFKDKDVQRLSGKEHKDYPKTHMPPSLKEKERYQKPGTVRVSKEDFFLHLKILCFLVMVIFGGTMYNAYNYIEKPVKKEKTMMEILQENEKKATEFVEPALPISQIRIPPVSNDLGDPITNAENLCSLYLTESSIPEAGFGVFSTQEIHAGETIFPMSKSFKVTLDEDHEGSSVDVEIPIHAMLLKYHPLLANATVTKHRGIIAKETIQPGQELFLDLADFEHLNVDVPDLTKIYQQKLHLNDPSMKTYEKVDSIVQEVINAIPHRLAYNTPKIKNYKKRSQTRSSAMKVPSVDAGRILTLVKDSLAEYNGQLANLIPDTTVWARSLLEAGGAAKFISDKRPVEWIVKHGLCLSGLSSESSCPTKQAMIEQEKSMDLGAFATRSVRKGGIIASSPLYAVKGADSPKGGNCIIAPNVDNNGVYLCPLSFFAHLRKGDDCESESGRDECPSNTVNAIWRFSEYNVVNESLSQVPAIQDILKNPMTGFTIDIIANRNIARNEEVFVDFERYSE